MASQQEQSNHERRTNKGIIIIISVMACIIVVLAAVVLTQIPSKDTRKDQDSKDVNVGNDSVLERGFVDENNAGEVASEMAKKLEEGMFECKMSVYWTFDDAQSASPNSYVANVENNRYTFYFDLIDPSTQEVYYSSPLVPVGSEVRNIKLDKALPAGEHEMQVQYTMVDDSDDYKEVSSVGFMITVMILK